MRILFYRVLATIVAFIVVTACVATSARAASTAISNAQSTLDIISLQGSGSTVTWETMTSSSSGWSVNGDGNILASTVSGSPTLDGGISSAAQNDSLSLSSFSSVTSHTDGYANVVNDIDGLVYMSAGANGLDVDFGFSWNLSGDAYTQDTGATDYAQTYSGVDVWSVDTNNNVTYHVHHDLDWNTTMAPSTKTDSGYDYFSFHLAAWETFSFTIYNDSDVTGHSSPVPEPATVALLGIGLVGLAGAEIRRRRKKKAVDNS